MLPVMASTRLYRLVFVKLLLFGAYLSIVADDTDNDTTTYWEVDLMKSEVAEINVTGNRESSTPKYHLDGLTCFNMRTVKICGGLVDDDQAISAAVVHEFLDKIVSCKSEIRVIKLEEPNMALAHRIELAGEKAAEFSKLMDLHVKIERKVMTLGQILRLTHDLVHLNLVLVKILPLDRAAAFRKLRQIKTCDWLEVDYGHHFTIDFKQRIFITTDTTMIGLAKEYESLRLFDPKFTDQRNDQKFRQSLGMFDKVYIRTDDFEFVDSLFAREWKELHLRLMDLGEMVGVHYQDRERVKVDVIGPPKTFKKISQEVKSLEIFYDLWSPTDNMEDPDENLQEIADNKGVNTGKMKGKPKALADNMKLLINDMDWLLKLEMLEHFNMAEDFVALPTAPSLSPSTSAHFALIVLLALLDAKSHWPNLQTFQAFLPNVNLSELRKNFIYLARVEEFQDELLEMQTIDVNELYFIAQLRNLFEVKSLTSVTFRFTDPQQRMADNIFMYLKEFELDGWLFELSSNQIVGSKTLEETLLINPKMATLTPYGTISLRENCVKDADGKLLQLVDVAAEDFNRLERFDKIKIVGPTRNVFGSNKALDKYMDLLNGHIEQTRTIILDSPTKEVLIDIGLLTKRQMETTHLQVKDLPSSISFDSQFFQAIFHLERLVVILTQDATLPLDTFVQFVKQNPALKSILFEFAANNVVSRKSDDVSTTQPIAVTITSILEELHSLSGAPRMYDYLMLADTDNTNEVFGIDTEQKLLQTSEIGLITKYGYQFKHLRVFLVREQVHFEILYDYIALNSIERLHIDMYDNQAREILKNIHIKAFSRNISINIFTFVEKSGKILVDNIVRENGHVKLFMKWGLLTQFILDDTKSLQIYGYDIELTKATQLAALFSRFTQLRELDIHERRVSLCVMEYVANNWNFGKLKKLFLHQVGTAEVYENRGIFKENSLDLFVIRQIRYDAFFDASQVIKSPSKWSIQFDKMTMRAAYARDQAAA